MGKRIFVVSIVFLLALATACSTTSVIKPASLPAGETVVQKLPKLPFSSIFIQVESKAKDSKEEVLLLKDLLSKELRVKGKTIVETGTSTDIAMSVVVTHLKKVSPGSRFFWGGFAGSAKLKAEVTVVVNGTVYKFVVDTASRDWSGFTGTTDTVLKATAAKIVAEIL